MIETKRTRLRRFKESDLPHLIELETDNEIMRYTRSGGALPESEIKERLDRMLRDEEKHAPLGIWAAEMKDTGDFVGWFMLLKTSEPELGFMLVKRHWGKGLATEVSQALVDYGFNVLGLSKIIAGANTGNDASIRILEKLGFKFIKAETEYNEKMKKNVELQCFEIEKPK